MKSSLYNTFIKATSSSTVIYNSLVDKTIICKGDININNILSQPESLRTKLENEGFIVPESKDEYQFYVNEAREAEDDGESFHLLINPTLNCNFNCWYCYESHVPSKMSEDIINKIKQLIKNIYQEGRYLTISFFGGEPMLYYNEVMIPILKYAHKEAHKASCRFDANMTSNGYLLNQQRIKELSKYNFNGGQITLDGDRDYHNSVRFHRPDADTFTKIVENIHFMVKESMTVTLRINCTHENLKSLINIPNAFKHFTREEKNRVKTDLHIVWQEGDQTTLYQKMDNAVEVFNSLVHDKN